MTWANTRACFFCLVALLALLRVHHVAEQMHLDMEHHIHQRLEQP